ncbi:MAG TPA: hypothetical protein VHP34_01935 [Alphaproteobacteria bacterium]|nr:hypothetical protein [Alphaproteobacteria bacterium]
MPQLCIGIPSHRPLAACEATIKSAVDYCLEQNVRLFVSDNSGDDEKEARLKEIVSGNGLTYARRPPCDMMENWFAAFNGTEGDYVLMMGDDDRLMSLGAAQDIRGIPSDVAGIRPTILAYLEPRGITNINLAGIQSEKPAERIVEHIKTSNGANIGIFSFWRRDIFKSIMELHFLAHPTKGTYSDWSLMNGLVSSGRVTKLPMSCYFYDMKNWMGDAVFVQKQVERAFEASGLPGSAAAYATVLNALDSFIYVARKDSPLSKEDRVSTGLFCLTMLLENFSQRIPAAATHPNAKAINALAHKLIGNRNAAALFDIAIGIVSELQDGLDKKYKSFFEQATGYAYGRIE